LPTQIHGFFAEIPWYIPASLLLVAVVMLWTGNARVDRKLKRIGLAAFLAGVLLMLVSWMLVSNREVVMSQTRQLVRAVETRDWTKMQTLMHPKALAYSVTGRESLTHAVRGGVEWIDLKSITITSVSTRPETEVLTVVLGVYSNAKPEFSLPTNWELDWAYIDGRWQLAEIRGLDGWAARATNLAAWIERQRGR
jgi:hypothetical protein